MPVRLSIGRAIAQAIGQFVRFGETSICTADCTVICAAVRFVQMIVGFVRQPVEQLKYGFLMYIAVSMQVEHKLTVAGERRPELAAFLSEGANAAHETEADRPRLLFADRRVERLEHRGQTYAVLFVQSTSSPFAAGALRFRHTAGDVGHEHLDLAVWRNGRRAVAQAHQIQVQSQVQIGFVGRWHSDSSVSGRSHIAVHAEFILFDERG